MWELITIQVKQGFIITGSYSQHLKNLGNLQKNAHNKSIIITYITSLLFT
jgi:hypothetical protein